MGRLVLFCVVVLLSVYGVYSKSDLLDSNPDSEENTIGNIQLQPYAALAAIEKQIEALNRAARDYDPLRAAGINNLTRLADQYNVLHHHNRNASDLNASLPIRKRTVELERQVRKAVKQEFMVMSERIRASKYALIEHVKNSLDSVRGSMAASIAEFELDQNLAKRPDLLKQSRQELERILGEAVDDVSAESKASRHKEVSEMRFQQTTSETSRTHALDLIRLHEARGGQGLHSQSPEVQKANRLALANMVDDLDDLIHDIGAHTITDRQLLTEARFRETSQSSVPVQPLSAHDVSATDEEVEKLQNEEKQTQQANHSISSASTVNSTASSDSPSPGTGKNTSSVGCPPQNCPPSEDDKRTAAEKKEQLQREQLAAQKQLQEMDKLAQSEAQHERADAEARVKSLEKLLQAHDATTKLLMNKRLARMGQRIGSMASKAKDLSAEK